MEKQCPNAPPGKGSIAPVTTLTIVSELSPSFCPTMPGEHPSVYFPRRDEIQKRQDDAAARSTDLAEYRNVGDKGIFGPLTTVC